MERLPIELHEQIFSHLLEPRRRWTDITSAPVSNDTERANIYNLRLTSRRVNKAAVGPFAQTIGDIPTKLSENSFRVLRNLLKDADLSNAITCLTFDACKLVISEKKPLTLYDLDCSARAFWIKYRLQSEAVDIFLKTPRLRHVTCFVEAMRASQNLGLTSQQLAILETYIRNIPDPISEFHEALDRTRMKEKLETMSILLSSYEGIDVKPLEEKAAVEYPNIKHLTLSPSYLEVSEVPIVCPNLTTLHFVLDHGGDHDFPGTALGLPYDDVKSGLRSITISGKNDYVDTALLIQCIVPITENIPNLPLLIIRDMNSVWDVTIGIDRLPGEGRFKELIFDNVTYCWIDYHDESSRHGPSYPFELDHTWDALPRLCERADLVRVRSNGEERIMGRHEWEA